MAAAILAELQRAGAEALQDLTDRNPDATVERLVSEPSKSFRLKSSTCAVMVGAAGRLQCTY